MAVFCIWKKRPTTHNQTPTLQIGGLLCAGNTPIYRLPTKAACRKAAAQEHYALYQMRRMHTHYYMMVLAPENIPPNRHKHQNRGVQTHYELRLGIRMK